MSRWFAAVVAVVLLVPAGRAVGQTATDTTGAIVGRVTDQTSAVLPGVTVAVSGRALMGAMVTTTNGAGEYRFHALPPAEYTLVFTRDGFATRRRTAVPVGLGGTTTVDEVMHVAGPGLEVTADGGAPALDRKSASVVVRFDAAQLASLPGTRSMGAILSAMPAVEMARFDVGGSAGLTTGPSSTYGSTFTPPFVEGIGIASINAFGLTLDYGSFQEVSLTSGGLGPAAVTPGVRMQFITKSGGDRYHGSFYAAREDRRWQAFNIDQRQVARVAAAGDTLSRDANRLWSYHDLNADAGGFIRKNRVWWYASARHQSVSARLVTFPVRPHRTEARNVTGKGTYRVNARQHVVVFANLTTTRVPNLLDGFGPAGGVLNATSAINRFEDSTSKRLAAGSIVKAESTWAIGNSMFVEVRVGRFAARREEIPHGHAPRFENVTTSVVSGGNRDWEATLNRPQVIASATYFRDGPFGSHQLNIGSESYRWTETQSWRHAYPGDVLHVVRDDDLGQTRAAEVYLFRTPSRSASGLWWHSGHVSDSWQMHKRLSLTLGLRFDHFRSFLPEQAHPAGPVTATTRLFPAIDRLIAWNVASPRASLVHDLTGDGKTLAKASYGRYSLVPTPDLGFNANQNSNQPWQRWDWADSNGDGSWQDGEQVREIATRGQEEIDPALKLPSAREIVLSAERELAGGVALRSGLVWRGQRQPFLRQDASRPFSAYTVQWTIDDPGPNGVPGDADDGRDITVYPPPAGAASTIVRNVPGAGTDHWTWEVTAVKRSRGRWSLVAGFANTWSRDHATGYAGQTIRQNTYPLTPNDLINTGDRGRFEFTVWSAKIHGTCELPRGVRVTPFLRHQSGQPFGRTLGGAVPGINRILAEPIGTRRMDHLTVLDLRVEKIFQMPAHARVAAFIDAFNLLNGNPAQNINWVSGASFLRPLTIVPPRIARIGLKLDW